MFSGPPARNVFQSGHGATQGCQAAGAFALDEGFEGFTDQCRFLLNAGKLLGGADEVVVEGDGGSHGINYSIK
jgi:hypothetical protein